MGRKVTDFLRKHQGLLFLCMLTATAILPYAAGKTGLVMLALLCLVYGKVMGNIVGNTE